MATVERERERQCCGQRKTSAHADPGDDRHLAPSGIRVAGAQARADQARQGGRGKDPGDAHSDDGQADEQRLPDQRER